MQSLKISLTSRRASMLAAIVAASALVFVQPVFAQVPSGSNPDDPEPWGSTIVPNTSDYGDTNLYSFNEPHDYAAPASESPTLAPPPQQPAGTEPGSIYVPPPAVGPFEPYDYPPIDTAPPDSFARPDGGFRGAVGGFPIRSIP
jgi:hypothetical protein